jgi:hypothetical protein
MHNVGMVLDVQKEGVQDNIPAVLQTCSAAGMLHCSPPCTSLHTAYTMH